MPQIGVLKYDEVKLCSASRNLSGNLPDSSEQTQLFQQTWGDSPADIAHHDGLARFDSKYVGRIYTHIGATDDDRLYIWQRPRERRHECALSRLPNSKFFVTL